MEQVIYAVSSVDERRLNDLKVFLYSLQQNGGHWSIALCLINPYYYHVPDFRLINSDIDLVISYKKGYKKGFIQREAERMEKDVLSNMYVRLDGNMEILKLDCSKMLSIDTDVIIRKPLDKIWEGVEPSSIKVWERKGKPDFYKFQGGVIVYGNSPELRDYYQTALNKMEDRDVEAGQTALYTAYKEHEDKIKLVPLSEKYNDSKFRDDSIIWHCKHSHFHEKKYQKEYQHYLKLANEKIKSQEAQDRC